MAGAQHWHLGFRDVRFRPNHFCPLDLLPFAPASQSGERLTQPSCKGTEEGEVMVGWVGGHSPGHRGSCRWKWPGEVKGLLPNPFVVSAFW